MTKGLKCLGRCDENDLGHKNDNIYVALFECPCGSGVIIEQSHVKIPPTVGPCPASKQQFTTCEKCAADYWHCELIEKADYEEWHDKCKDHLDKGLRRAGE